MNRLFVPTLGPTDWRRLLAKPATQWEPFRSALEMAVSWESERKSARGIPPEVAKVLDSAPETRNAELLLGIPEHKVSFEGGGHPSQNDLWALLGAAGGLVSMTIEAKAGEKLDDLVRDWLPKAGERSGKPKRLIALRNWLAISDADVSHLRYQLLHRTASALKEARRFGAFSAVMIVQSFNSEADEESWQDLRKFAEVMAAPIEKGGLAQSQRPTAVPLFIGWVTSPPADLDRLRNGV